jgi:AraC family transcriptional regulator, regulatory protein of adaptative response / methylated-DNA-[protein]-cysteine methyltransferase
MHSILRETAPQMPFSTDEERWRAVIERNRRADGAFYYSVRTTGVYCRPSCGSRRPRRENVAFYMTCDEAERAGYRACMRCYPSASSSSDHSMLIASACRIIEEAEECPKLSELASKVGLSPFHFHRVFKAVTGLTPKSYAAAHRARRLAEVLPNAQTVTGAIYEAGFNSSSRFYASSEALLGMSPARYRSGGKHEVVRFAVGECLLGSILVASTDKGVCAILLGDDPEALLEDLQRRFSQAELVGGDKAFELLVSKIVGFVENPEVGLDLPLDVRGTAFQRKVWQALRQIPLGSTASYRDIARRIRSPEAVQAVAQACGANNLAVAIPCHRVIRRDGGLGGYRWGLDRKRTLLAHESRTTQRIQR